MNSLDEPKIGPVFIFKNIVGKTAMFFAPLSQNERGPSMSAAMSENTFMTEVCGILQENGFEGARRAG
jgi:hypothetical protein